MVIELDSISEFKVNNIINYNDEPYTIYDIDEDLYYISLGDHKLGVPKEKLSPIILNEEIFNLFLFDIIYRGSENYFIEDTFVIQSKYVFTDLSTFSNVEFSIFKNTGSRSVITFLGTHDIDNNLIEHLHQVQNICAEIFGKNKFVIIP